MATVLPSETPLYCFADDPEFNKTLVDGKIEKDSILLARNNFGCGSSREQAASTLKGHELIIVARDFARIFLQNSINLGLRTVICPDIEADLGDDLEVKADKVINKTTGKEFKIVPHAKTQQELIEAGGLIPYTRQRVLERAGK